MAEVKKYYWLKLEKNFFKRHDIQIIEDMENGKDYVLFYLKLILESMNHEGRLRFNDLVPYNDRMLATITNTNVDVVRSAIKLFQQLGLMEVWEDQTIFIHDTQKMLGSETSWAKKKREYRATKQSDLLLEDNVETIKDNVRQEIELEKELEIDKEIDKEKKKKTTTKRFSKPSIDELQQYITDSKFNIDAQHFFDYYESKGWLVGKSPMKDWKATVRNWNRRNEEDKPKPNSRTKVIKKAHDEKPPDIVLDPQERQRMINKIKWLDKNE